MGISVPGTALRVANTAAVMVTATLPPFAQPGTRIDVTAASAGDSSNLQGGLLLLTPLKGPDGQIYAVAQGPVVTGGFGAGKGSGNSQTVNHPTVGRVVNGALVEKGAPSIAPGSELRLQLRTADFTTAARIADAVNQRFGSNGKPAHAENSALVSIQIPVAYAKRTIEFIADVEAIPVEADRIMKVVVNERTGTIVMGKEVRIAPTSILHGNLSVEIQTTLTVSQPAPLSGGQTTVVPNVTVSAKESPAKSVVLKDGATVEELVRALTSIGSTPRDIIAILQALRASGALEAEMEVI
jgi:flagellar P-ring protein precursor FlgI